MSTKPRKSIIITGATSGLGYYCAEAIARAGQDWQIIVASRDLSKVKESVRKLISETEYPYIEGKVLNLASLASVRQFMQDFSSGEHTSLEAIVCNAGIQVVSETLTTIDGFEMTFGVNHLGHFLLVNLLLPNLGDRSRIVFVTSDTHDPQVNTGMTYPQYQEAKLLAFPNIEDNDNEIVDIGQRRYTTSKLCNILCAYELSRRLQNQHLHITVNAFNPGLMFDTRLARDYSQEQLSSLSANISSSVREKSKDSKTMGSILARLILDPALKDTTGKYFDGMEEVQSSFESYDQQKAADLWVSSMELVKLHSPPG